MRLIYLLYLSLFVFITNCKNKASSAVTLEKAVKVNLVTVKEVKKLRYRDFGIDANVAKITSNWKAYNEMALITEHVKKANFIDFKGDLIELYELIDDLKSQRPIALKVPSIYARIIVLETHLFKLHSLLNIQGAKKEALLDSVKAFLEAFSNFNFQINKKIERDSQRINRPARQ